MSAHWELLAEEGSFDLRRSGRFLVADLKVAHQVLSTSQRHGGQVDHVRYLLNHQSCEGTAHHDRHQVMVEHGLDAYHDRVCQEAGLPADRTAVMGTAANMNYAAVVREVDEDVCVTVAVTAGVEGNATTAGEPATWRETAAGMQPVPAAAPTVPAYAGTINTILVVNRPLTVAALARVVVTMTEGKTAALQRLAVPSKRHIDLATGTGTDQYCIAAPAFGVSRSGAAVASGAGGGTSVGTGAAAGTEADTRPLTTASPHMKLGELVGLATRKATMEALRWQNGLEASYTRGVFHALGRYGVKEATLFEDIAGMLSDADLELLKKNAKAAFYEPLVGASAHALAAVCDRVRYGTLPEAVAADAMTQQAAALAANLAAQVHRWAEFRRVLRPHATGDVKTLVLRALALGWSEKWRPR